MNRSGNSTTGAFADIHNPPIYRDASISFHGRQIWSNRNRLGKTMRVMLPLRMPPKVTIKLIQMGMARSSIAKSFGWGTDKPEIGETIGLFVLYNPFSPQKREMEQLAEAPPDLTFLFQSGSRLPFLLNREILSQRRWSPSDGNMPDFVTSRTFLFPRSSLQLFSDFLSFASPCYIDSTSFLPC